MADTLNQTLIYNNQVEILSTANRTSKVFQVGELVYDSQEEALYIGDLAQTPGGILLTNSSNLAVNKLDKSGDTMAGQLNMNSNAILNVPDPNDPKDAANKRYIDTAVNNLKFGLNLTINDLNDVDSALSPTDGDVLVYDGATQKFIVRPQNDVDNQSLTWDSSSNSLSISQSNSVTIDSFTGTTDFQISNIGIANITQAYIDNLVVTSPFSTIRTDIQGDVYAVDSTLIIDADTPTINLDGTVRGNIVPDQDIAYDLGTATNRFRDLYLSGSTINLGNAVISATPSGGLVLPQGTSLPGVTELRPERIIDDRQGAPYFSGTPVAQNSTIIDQATYLWAQSGGMALEFNPTTYSATIDGSGNVTDIIIVNPRTYGNEDNWEAINTDNMIALDPGININDPAAINASSQVEILLATVESGSVSTSSVDTVGIRASIIDSRGGPLQIKSGWITDTGSTVLVNPYGADTYLNMKAETISLSTGPYTPAGLQGTYPRIDFKTAGAFETKDGAYFKGRLDGDITGSVFADNSTMLVDGIEGKIVGNVENNTINTRSFSNETTTFKPADGPIANVQIDVVDKLYEEVIGVGATGGGDIFEGTFTNTPTTDWKLWDDKNVPNSAYSISNVVDNGGGSYTITVPGYTFQPITGYKWFNPAVDDVDNKRTISVDELGRLTGVDEIRGLKQIIGQDGETIVLSTKSSSGVVTSTNIVMSSTNGVRTVINGTVEFDDAVDFNGATISGVDWAPIVSSQIQANGLPTGTRFTTISPTTSRGASGDVQGAVAFDSNYIYYCTATYTDGVADIWKRVAWSGDTW